MTAIVPPPAGGRGPRRGGSAGSGTTVLFADPPPRPHPAAGARSQRREPALDGLRGAAVAAVVLYHAGVPRTTGGYLGVDAFFVLSGYLITTLLLDEWERQGTIDLGAFWRRRLRRLVPPVVITLVGVAALCLALDPAVIGSVRGDAVATVAYVMNWRLILESKSYFDQFTVSPLEHAWSLAIEEQFYLLWPPLVMVVLRASRSVRVLLAGAVGLAVASAVWMVARYEPGLDPSRLYFGTDTRAQAVLVGAALAAAVASGMRIDGERARRGTLRLAVLGAVIVLGAWMLLPGTSAVLYRGGFTLLAVLVALIIVAGTRLGDNRLRRVLSWRPLRALGLVSYGVYLYHFPIFIWLDHRRTGLAAGSLALLALRVGVTLAAAVVSYVAVEQPVRRARTGQVTGRSPWAGTLAGPALRSALGPACVVLALALVGLATGRAAPRVAEPAPPRPAAPPPTGDELSRVLVVGDSVAYTLATGLAGSVAADHRLSVLNDAILFCELSTQPRVEDGVSLPASDTCAGWENRWRLDATEFGPDVSVLQVGAWEIFDRLVGDEVIAFGSAAADRLLDDQLERAVAALSASGAVVAVVTSPPLLRGNDGGTPEWTPDETWRIDHFNDRLRALAARHPDTVQIVDLAGYLCPASACRATIDGAAVRPDGLHYGRADAPVVARWLAERLVELT